MPRKQNSLKHDIFVKATKDVTNNTSRTSYKRSATRFSKWAKENNIKKISEISEEVLQRYHDDLKNDPKQYTAATIHTYLAPIAKASGINLNRIKKQKRTSDQIVRGRKHEANEQGKRQKLNSLFSRLVQFQKVVGIRRNELKNLRGKDLKFDKHGISIFCQFFIFFPLTKFHIWHNSFREMKEEKMVSKVIRGMSEEEKQKIYDENRKEMERCFSVTNAYWGIDKVVLNVKGQIVARMPLGIVNNKYFDKHFKSKKEARQAEIDLLTKINQIENNEFTGIGKGDILFKDFYENVWWEYYKAGQTTSTTKPPSRSTIANTKTCFRKHILPMLGNYTIQFLNQNKQVILNLMTAKANEYANFKTLRSYVISIFDWAEELEYIESNKIAKTLRRIKSTKKIQLAEARRDEDLYLTHEQLQEWFLAFQDDLASRKISLKDYVLFYLTFFLGDRKSESYALQWKHINFEKSQIQLLQALDRYGDVKSTKGNKKTTFAISSDLLQLLQNWKKQQRQELAKFGIITNSEQFVFTYVDTKGNVNKPLHADYLNNKMRTVKNRHPYLTHATPHKLRHTGATLAKQAGMSLEAISQALTHSDTTTTQIYVNTSNVIPMAVGEFALNSLKQ